MKKLLFCIIASFTFWGSAIADDDVPEELPPAEVQAHPIALSRALVKAPLNNNNQLVKVQVSDNKGIVLYQVITSSSSISIDAEYLQKDLYTITITPL